MTGSSGPKVGHLVARTLAASHSLVGVDAQPGTHTHCLADIRAVADWTPLLDGVDAVVHFAALHAPHRETHSRDAFLATNVDATSRLVEAATQQGVHKFVLASTTSVYGRSMRTPGRAAWVTESMPPIAEDIYDETKLAAEALCRDAFSDKFQTVALRFSRCFPEPPPLMALYRLYRGIDARDVADAFRRALDQNFARFAAINISGATPFQEDDCEALWHAPENVLNRRAPGLVAAFRARGWDLPHRIDRVYVSSKAERELNFVARYGWDAVPETHELKSPETGV
jgi:nucleoside-diphosphate-sugar epimerase